MDWVRDSNFDLSQFEEISGGGSIPNIIIKIRRLFLSFPFSTNRLYALLSLSPNKAFWWVDIV